MVYAVMSVEFMENVVVTKEDSCLKLADDFRIVRFEVLTVVLLRIHVY